ncbi:hypothetical protein T484DRAFT_1816323 [Baffinella frigidus]|nr:hypothetical protein T484DRAFT_1816323 [Cryptophyta sp. CCMP2293]
MAPRSPSQLLLAAVALAFVLERGHALHGLRGGSLAPASPGSATLAGAGVGLRRRPAHLFLSMRGGGTSSSSGSSGEDDVASLPVAGEGGENPKGDPLAVPIGEMPPDERMHADMQTAAFFAAAYAAASLQETLAGPGMETDPVRREVLLAQEAGEP